MTKDVSEITPGYESIREFEGNWYVAHTKSRFEKAFVKDLYNLGMKYYLPMKEKIYVSSGKKRRSLLPLFTSYVFFCSPDPEARAKAFKTNRIASLMDVVETEKFISELAVIETALRNDINVSLIDFLPAGQACRVISGAMLGTEGVVIGCVTNKSRIVIEVSVLGKCVEMELDSSMLEKN